MQIFSKIYFKKYPRMQMGASIIKYSGIIVALIGLIYAAYKMLSTEETSSLVSPPPVQTIRANTLQVSQNQKY